jgi:predicted aconitase with swiveling domain
MVHDISSEGAAFVTPEARGTGTGSYVISFLNLIKMILDEALRSESHLLIF